LMWMVDHLTPDILCSPLTRNSRLAPKGEENPAFCFCDPPSLGDGPPAFRRIHSRWVVIRPRCHTMPTPAPRRPKIIQVLAPNVAMAGPSRAPAKHFVAHPAARKSMAQLIHHRVGKAAPSPWIGGSKNMSAPRLFGSDISDNLRPVHADRAVANPIQAQPFTIRVALAQSVGNRSKSNVR